MLPGQVEVARLSIPWPPKPLWLNRPGHWTKESAARRQQRALLYGLGLEAGLHKLRDASATLAFTFHPPDARRRDIHNMPPTMKGAIDGVADAMGVDDECFNVVWPRAWAEKVRSGLVTLTVYAER